MENFTRFLCCFFICCSVIGSAVFIEGSLTNKFNLQQKEFQSIIGKQNLIINELIFQAKNKDKPIDTRTYQKNIKPLYKSPATVTINNSSVKKSALVTQERIEERNGNRKLNDKQCAFWTAQHSKALDSGDKSRIRTAVNEKRESCKRALYD